MTPHINARGFLSLASDIIGGTSGSLGPLALYNSYRDKIELFLRPLGSRVKWLNTATTQHEAISPTFEDHILLVVLFLLDHRLPNKVLDSFGGQLEDSDCLMDLKTEILENVPGLLAEIQLEDILSQEARKQRTEPLGRDKRLMSLGNRRRGSTETPADGPIPVKDECSIESHDRDTAEDDIGIENGSKKRKRKISFKQAHTVTNADKKTRPDVPLSIETKEIGSKSPKTESRTRAVEPELEMDQIIKATCVEGPVRKTARNIINKLSPHSNIDSSPPLDTGSETKADFLSKNNQLAGSDSVRRGRPKGKFEERKSVATHYIHNCMVDSSKAAQQQTDSSASAPLKITVLTVATAPEVATTAVLSPGAEVMSEPTEQMAGELTVVPEATAVRKTVAPVSTIVQKAVTPVSAYVQKTVAPVSTVVQKAVAPVAADVQKTVAPVVSTVVQKAVAPIAAEVQKTVAPVVSTVVQKAVAPVSADVQKTVAPVSSVVQKTIVPITTAVQKTIVPKATGVQKTIVLIATAVQKTAAESATEETDGAVEIAALKSPGETVGNLSNTQLNQQKKAKFQVIRNKPVGRARSSQQYECPVCREVFSRAGDLLDHSEIHRPVTCPTCGLSFPNEVTLQEHYKKHDMERRRKLHKCSVCGLKFVSPVEFIVHQKSHTKKASTGSTHKCAVCRKVFSKPGQLYSHFKIHNEELTVYLRTDRQTVTENSEDIDDPLAPDTSADVKQLLLKQQPNSGGNPQPPRPPAQVFSTAVSLIPAPVVEGPADHCSQSKILGGTVAGGTVAGGTVAGHTVVTGADRVREMRSSGQGGSIKPWSIEIRSILDKDLPGNITVVDECSAQAVTISSVTHSSQLEERRFSGTIPDQ